MHQLTILERSASALSRMLAVVGLGMLLVFAAATLLDALLRGLAGTPIEWVRDLGGYIAAAAVACCFPLGFYERHNITITAIDLRIGARLSQVLNVLAALVVLAVLVGIALEFWSFAGKIARAGETSIMLDIPEAPVWFFVDAVFWCCVIVQAVVLMLETARLFGNSPAPERHETSTP